MKENVKLPFLEDLGPLEAFDPKAFMDDDPQVQKVCDFVLALALIFNDFKDLFWIAYTIKKSSPPFDANFHETPEWGHFTGADHHIHRLQATVLVELANLIDKSAKTISKPLFQNVLKNVDAIERKAWDEMANPDSELRKHLLNLRDKLSAHYYYSENGDQKVIPDGFRAAFKGTERRPYLSWGKNILGTRFYFADAAALEVDKLIRSPGWKEKFDAHTNRVSRVVSGIIYLFLLERKCKPEKI